MPGRARAGGRAVPVPAPETPWPRAVREGEAPPGVGRAARVVEDEHGRAARAAAVGEELLPGSEHAELDELDGVVALPAAEQLVDGDQMVHGTGRRRREEDERQRCGAEAQGLFRILSGYVPVKFCSIQSGVSEGSTYQSVGHMVRISTKEKPWPSSWTRKASPRMRFVHAMAAGVCIAPRAT